MCECAHLRCSEQPPRLGDAAVTCWRPPGSTPPCVASCVPSLVRLPLSSHHGRLPQELVPTEVTGRRPGEDGPRKPGAGGKSERRSSLIMAQAWADNARRRVGRRVGGGGAESVEGVGAQRVMQISGGTTCAGGAQGWP